jgi:putative tryptophan/tyrosine transport system substrate-binding protein
VRTIARAFAAIGALAVLAASLPAFAQQASKVPHIAYVWLASTGPSAPYAESFRGRMAELGWVEGRNIRADYIDAGGNRAKLDAIMEGLVRDKVDLIVAMCTPEALSAKKFTSTIPVVMAATGDPVAAGVVDSLAHPGGNITGVSMMSLPLSAKRVELLKQAFPKLTQTTVLWNPARPDNGPEVKTMQDAAARLGLKVQSDEIRSRDELTVQLDAIAWDGTQSLLNAGDPLLGSEARTIAEKAAKLKVPALFEDRYFVENGGLMSYGADLRKLHQHAADYVDKILRGAKPGDLPIEQPTNFELVINKRTAKAMGVTIPYNVLVQATEVIE